MCQRTLDGFNCCSAAPKESERYGLIGDSYCDPGQGGCYSPAQRPELLQVFASIGGLDFPDLTNRIAIPELPVSIQTIRGDSSPRFQSSLLGPVIATRYTEIGGLRLKPIDAARVAAWRVKRNIPIHRGILLHQEDVDDRLESLFPATLRPGFFAAIADIGNVLLVSPGYSIYDNHKMCEWLQLLNLKRSIHFAYLANRAGLPCIPCIGWHKDRVRDLERLSEWLSRQGDKVTHLAVNAQTGGADLWALLVQGMTYIENATGRRYRWVVFGGTDVLPVIFSHFHTSRVIHVSAGVVAYTVRHRLLGQRSPNDLQPDELLRQNLAFEAGRRSDAALLAEQAHLRVSVK
jgi:hypothetical protein